MNHGVAVSDASPLIALDQIERLDLLQGQFDRVVVPSVVVREVAPSVGALPIWVARQRISVPPDFLTHHDVGEREAIVLAMHLAATFVVIDDLEPVWKGGRLGVRLSR